MPNTEILLTELQTKLNDLQIDTISDYRGESALKAIDTCSHIFISTDDMKNPLEPLYSGPFEVVHRNSDRVFTIRIDDKDVAVSVDRLKPAFLIKDEITMARSVNAANNVTE